MKLINNDLQFSISDIVQYFKSPYASYATWSNLQNPGHISVENNLIQNTSLQLRSEENEADAKRYLINNYEEVKSITNPLETLSESKELIVQKKQVIVQPTLTRENFIGRADFLIFDDKQQLYEVMDAKLAKQIKPEFLLQVCGYSWMLEEYQKDLPKKGWFFLGNEEVESFKLQEFYRFFLDLKEEFLETIQTYSLDTIPRPKKWESFEEYSQAANLYWGENRSLELIADISSRQIEILEKESYTTIDAVPSIKETSFTKLTSESLDKIKRQANAQLKSTEENTHVELRNGDESIYHLHTMLPEENPGDVYFDLEGYPFYDIRSSETMEYLYGAAYKNSDGEMEFKDDLWADNHYEEEEIFCKFVEWIEDRIKKYPNLKIYHYAHYEKTSLLKSAQKFGKYEIEIDKWLKEDRLVDLYAVVRKAFIVGKDSYSIKRIEEVAGYKRELDLSSGMDSIFYFERYLTSGDIEEKEKLKNEILLYNKDDCYATEVVCNWLREKQSEYSFIDTISIEESISSSEPSKNELEDMELLDLEQQILAIQNTDLPQNVIEFVSTMPGYYRREERVQWQEYFKLKSMPLEDKINESTAFGLLSLKESPTRQDNKYIFSCECHDNTFKKVKKGSEVSLLIQSESTFQEEEITVNVEELTSNPFIMTFSVSVRYFEKVKERAGEEVFNNKNFTGFIHPLPIKLRNVHTNSYNSIKDIASNLVERESLPSIVQQLILKKSDIDFSSFTKEDDSFELLLKISESMNNSYLPIQGPPGTGKSTILGKVAAELGNSGKKIGIVAPSYAAVLNLVKKIIPHLNEEKIACSGFSGDLKEEIESLDSLEILSNDDKALGFNLVATSVNKICHHRYEEFFDYLIIDEVGQVPIITTMATVRSTKNLILIGDPNQLPQVRNGSHPNDNGLSTFEYLIEQQTTLPEDKGIFLDTTFRMHEDVNNFISSYFYDEKLTNHNITNDRHLKHESKEFKSTGIQFLPVPHKGNTQASLEEVQKVSEIVETLLSSKLINNESERLLTPEDILIVSPYNLQVFELSKKLGENYRVGTVDKFQGQEAPVVVVSLAASNYEEAPRGIDFILNFNRMNVALSRSQCLSIVVGSPSLTHLHYQNLNSIRLTNFHRTLMSSN